MNIKSSKIFRTIIRRDPIFITLIYIGFIWLILVITVYFGTTGMRKSYTIISFIATIIITAIPIIITFYHILSYRKTLSSFKRLLSLMVQIVLLFATMYFIMQALSISHDIESRNFTTVNEESLPFSNISNAWYHRLLNEHPDKLETLYYALLSYQDCIHFSIVTSSTVGYGDIVPKSSFAKLLVDIQIMLSFIIVVFGISVFISMRTNTSQDNKIHGTKEKIESNLSIASKTKLHEWEKYSDLMLHKFRDLKNSIEDELNKREK